MLDIKKILNELPNLHISDEDYEALINALKTNKLKEQAEKQKQQRDAWMKIIEAIDEYEEKYGLIKIYSDNYDGAWDFSLYDVGKIEVFPDEE